jgi:hypothetical protein
MSLPRRVKLTLSRIIATGACLTALVAYSAFSPAVSYADPLCAEGGCACECKFGGGTYSEGACLNGKSCACIHGDNGCSNCVWSCCCT